MSDSRGNDSDLNAAEPAGDDPRTAAREQFVHGLLEAMHKDDTAQVERRVSGVLERLEEPLPLRPATRRPWALLSGLAAAIILIVAGVLGIPTQQSAAAMVQASLLASKTAGDRRYDVRATFGQASEIHYATLDVRDPEHYVIRAILSKGDDLVVGRDAIGDWALKHTGEIDRLPPRKLLPSWVNAGEGAVGMVSVDDVLGALGEAYTLKRLTHELLPNGKGPQSERVSAERVGEDPMRPRRVEMWFDPQTHLLRWMELYFDPAAPAADQPPPRRRPPGAERRPPPPRPDGKPMSNPMRERRSPPQKLVFELTGTEGLGAEWFTPETHSRIRTEGK